MENNDYLHGLTRSIGSNVTGLGPTASVWGKGCLSLHLLILEMIELNHPRASFGTIRCPREAAGSKGSLPPQVPSLVSPVFKYPNKKLKHGHKR